MNQSQYPKDASDIFDRVAGQPNKPPPSFTSPHDLLPAGRSAENADEYTDPRDQELFRNVFSRPEPDDLAQLHQAALDEQNQSGWWQKHFGSSPALDTYAKARYSYEDQLQKEFDTQRIFQTAGPMHPSLGGLQAPNPIFDDQANRITQEQQETDFYKKNNPVAYISEHPVKAAYKATARMISPVSGPEEASGAEGYYPLIHGTYKAATAPNLSESLKAGTEAMQGLGETLTPLQYTMAGLAPKTLIKYTAGSELGSGLAQDIAERSGLSPEAQDFISATSGLVGGLALGLHEHLNSDLNRPMDSHVVPAADTIPISEKAQATVAPDGVSPLRPRPTEPGGLTRGPLPERFKPIVPDGDGLSGVGDNSSVSAVERIEGPAQNTSPAILEDPRGQGGQYPTDNSNAATRYALQNRFLAYLYENVPHDLAGRYSAGVSTFLSKFPENATLNFDRADAERYVALRRDEGASYTSIKSDLNAFDSFRTWVIKDITSSLMGPALAGSSRFQARTGRSPLTLEDLRTNLQRRYGSSVRPDESSRINSPSPLEEKLAESGSDQVQDTSTFTQPEKPSSPPQSATPAMNPVKLRNIEKAKARYTPERLEELRQAYEEDQGNRTLAALSGYGRASSEVKDLEEKLDLANRAEQKGFSRGSLDAEKRASIEKALAAARGRADSAFAQHVQGLTDDEANSLIQDIEKPAYKEIGQALQLHKLLKHDPIVKSLKQALAEDMSQPGLSQTSRTRVREILGDENVGVRLTKGPSGQRTRIYDKLGYTTSPDQAFKFLKFAPTGANAQEIWDRVEMARNVARGSLENETDPQKRAVLSRILETHQKDLIHDGALIARKGEYKHNPILVNPKVKGTARLSGSEFFNADLPGELHEISLKNLTAILGKSSIRSKVGELTPEQNSLLRNAETDHERRGYRAQFVRERVQQLHDNATRAAKQRMEQVRWIKEIRGIPSDHLTPLEAKLAAIMDAEQKRQTSQPAGLLNAPRRSTQPQNRRQLRK